MPSDVVIIIGNGFDVSHGLLSKYSNFKEWLHKNNVPLYETLNKYIDTSGEWWNEFERNLAEFHVLKLIEDAPRDYPPRDAKFPPSPYYPASGFFKNIRKEITNSFTEWAQSLTCNTTKRLLNIPDHSLCISFNYTDTLEKVYDVPENQVLYIHGKASRGDDLIFGHNKSHYELEEMAKKKYHLYESNNFFVPGTFGDAEYQLTLEISFLDKFPYTQLVKYDNILTQAVLKAKSVWVYGLAFSEVDFQYIEWIVYKNPNLFWEVSWHTEKDKTMVTETFRSLGFKNYRLFYA